MINSQLLMLLESGSENEDYNLYSFIKKGLENGK